MSAALTDDQVREALLSTIECFIDTSPNLEAVNDGAGPMLNRAVRGSTGDQLLRVHIGGRVFTVSVEAEDR